MYFSFFGNSFVCSMIQCVCLYKWYNCFETFVDDEIFSDSIKIGSRRRCMKGNSKTKKLLHNRKRNNYYRFSNSITSDNS